MSEPSEKKQKLAGYRKTDIALKVGDIELYFYKDILTEYSEYFKALFNSTQETTIEIDDNLETVKSLLDLIHPVIEASLTLKNVFPIFKLAYKWDMKVIMAQCSEYILKECQPYLFVIKTYHDYKLNEQRDKLIERYVDHVRSKQIEDQSFEILSNDCKTELLKVFYTKCFGTSRYRY